MEFKKSDINLVSKIVSDSKLLEKIQYDVKGYQELMTRYRCAIMEVETKLNVLNAEFSLRNEQNPVKSIDSRLKSIEGIVHKAQRNNIPPNIESIEKEMFDIAGVRVICSFTEDIYNICDWLLDQDDIRLISKKDYIKNPKPNGYRSLHLIIEIPIFLQKEKKWMKVEVQLRTIGMDFWASLEHKIKYKKSIPKEIEQEIVSELTECATISATLDEKMEAIKHKIMIFCENEYND